VAAPVEVTREMFDDLRAMVTENKDHSDKEFALLNGKNDSLEQRMSEAEAQIELLKKMGAPKGDDGAGAGLLDALNEITDKLRKEFMDKLDDLTKRLEALEEHTAEVDDKQQEEIDALKLMEK